MLANEPEATRRSELPMLLLCAWIAAGATFLMLVRSWGPSADALARTLEVDLPGMSALFLTLGVWLGSLPNMLIACGLLLATAVPFVVGMRGRAALRVYGTLLVIGVLGLTAAWAGLKRPIDRISDLLNEADTSAPR